MVSWLSFLPLIVAGVILFLFCFCQSRFWRRQTWIQKLSCVYANKATEASNHHGAFFGKHQWMPTPSQCHRKCSSDDHYNLSFGRTCRYPSSTTYKIGNI
ncbi:hypothetical protein BCR33DRAFT_170221 [Rhizoclosmatium globosum]|uniref:Uncharacterized protein n=1 Tax=Rhizoclosmatium globosum TaxID=329046 RepID=A0A1Y2CES0_9FUNG|nr:hypothetical protein BCR33DRAFT_170221 [Rhizoclosmatium globosum]|eukprot:ORY45558.1 hypothetical protein BCR33DRAFT_170221 [Rhizoclosmatium globosum]